MAWSSPVPVGTRIGSNFGPRGSSIHLGDDYPPPKPGQQGVPVYAIGDGVVVGVGANLLKGHSGDRNVLIKHPGNIYSYYGHLNSNSVRLNQSVKGGQQIGVMGYRGNVVPKGPGGTHLHLGIIVNGSFVDPSVWLSRKGITVGKTAPVKPSKTTTPSKEQRTYSTLRIDGVRGKVTLTAWQILLKYIAVPRRYTGRIDGVYGVLSNKAEQSWLAALGFYKGRIDGVRGPVHIKALQSFLRKKGLYSGRIDGSEGPLTVKAEQRYLNDQRRYL